ncbi:hemerythrin domain-containing protein [Solirubrobacter phytolaccae]|uniref:Hemerythrin domain-containing protein n=1 Tax=Solirubrobacter phytolaccae TaxID=1404360 RepID=A0A9X3NB66_9ACTN|nr:hemerythrin domain-containing protein [Solirubrobacter phytolaccae]MDA0181899.1 hemerythrin domain-containing protein [Solirubrobacter phytolaccae]
MKRAPELTRLSHDHHHALDVARRLRRAHRDSLEDVLDQLHAFLRTRGEEHFEVEERLFTPGLCAGDPRWEPAVARMLAEHADLRGRATTVADVAAAHALGDALHDHVRFEERELFPIVEVTLAQAELERLQSALTV